jgi:hypothetical protein
VLKHSQVAKAPGARQSALCGSNSQSRRPVLPQPMRLTRPITPRRKGARARRCNRGHLRLARLAGQPINDHRYRPYVHERSPTHWAWCIGTVSLPSQLRHPVVPSLCPNWGTAGIGRVKCPNRLGRC